MEYWIVGLYNAILLYRYFQTFLPRKIYVIWQGWLPHGSIHVADQSCCKVGGGLDIVVSSLLISRSRDISSLSAFMDIPREDKQVRQVNQK